MKKLKEILIWLFIVTYLIVTFGFINREHDRVSCKLIDVEIVDNTGNYFIEKEDIITLLNNKGAKLIGEKIKNIDRYNLEEIIDKHPTVKSADVFFDHNGVVNIHVSQRKPIVRIINENEESYYIDEMGFLMPLSDQFTAHVIIVNGNINESYHNYYSNNVMSENDSVNKTSEILKGIYQLANFITNDEFWNAQIQQIYFNNKNEIELIPRVGSHIILFGKAEGIEKKFRKLKAVYDYGFKKFGWNKYRMINLKYKNQVICTKK